MGLNPQYREATAKLGELLGKQDIGLVYGGASFGLMGTLADSVLAHGVHVIGVIPKTLKAKELAHPGLSDLRVVGSMHERKAMMEDLSQAFIALPGGIGTLEEIFEILTWAQLRIHKKPCGLLNIAGYYDGLISFLNTMASEGFLAKHFEKRLLVRAEPGMLLDQLNAAVEANTENM